MVTLFLKSRGSYPLLCSLCWSHFGGGKCVYTVVRGKRRILIAITDYALDNRRGTWRSETDQAMGLVLQVGPIVDPDWNKASPSLCH